MERARVEQRHGSCPSKRLYRLDFNEWLTMNDENARCSRVNRDFPIRDVTTLRSYKLCITACGRRATSTVLGIFLGGQEVHTS
ncbi:hypothetical protein AMS68_004568 [Peltaster fructicola]|uniref:Uncharacterized protein n=1 Tax=Peltaster fructicola TaxID=286661 RepID=A0A6H0XWL3_9PEZI|nr:hypothetical protein AMS68_004568 [Peltaster fructicola]